MRAKKSFGQHFLNNEAIAQCIADALTIDGERETVDGGRPAPRTLGEKAKILEVGPGKGMLTKYLLEKDIDLKVVEADRDMVEYLHLNYIQLHGRVISEDFLKLNFENIFPKLEKKGSNQFSIIGNFPYNISSQIVFKMLDNRALVPELVGMFQKEMAERIAAPPGNKTYGVISVLTQAFYEGEYLFSVGNHNFTPPPKVQSGVIRLKRKNRELGCDEKLFKKVVKQAFSQRRKMLRNTLKPFFKNAEIFKKEFFRKRPEVLSVEEFVELTNLVEQNS